MPRPPFVALVAGLSIAAAAVAAAIKPGRVDIAAGVGLGMAVAGGFAALALAILRRLRAEGGSEGASRMVNAYLGLMLARMLGYLAFIGLMVVLKAGDPASFCAGLIGGTMVFQVLEVIYIRKMS